MTAWLKFHYPVEFMCAILKDVYKRKGYSKDYIHSFSAVMQQSFRFAVFPKQYITFNPMQYIKLRYQTDEVDLFSDEDMDGNIQPISREDYERLLAYLKKKNPAAILPIQICLLYTSRCV